MRCNRIRSTHAHVVTCDDGTLILYSYTTPVAVYVPDEGCSITSEYYSRTTNSHIREFIRAFSDGCAVGTLTETELLTVVESKLGSDFDRRAKSGNVWTNRPTMYGY